MPTLEESQLAATLAQGLDVLSASESVEFVGYQRYVLPLDGFVFWVIDRRTRISGSLHVSVDKRQNEDETLGLTSVIFTTTQEVHDLRAVSPTFMWVADYHGARFAFAAQHDFYQQAGLYHYVGTAVNPVMLTQLVDDPSTLAAMTPIVSNSLPIWLALNAYTPIDPVTTRAGVTLFPSFAVPDNLPPPYGAVHCDATEAIASAPTYGPTMSRSQLVRERVRITTYGLDNDGAMDLLDAVLEYALNANVVGISSMPVVRDERRPQVELSILAQKKTIDLDVNYHQARARDVARTLIASCVVAATVVPILTGA